MANVSPCGVLVLQTMMEPPQSANLSRPTLFQIIRGREAAA